MNLKEQLFKIEKELDSEIDKLSIWELPFQTILCMLYLTVSDLDYKGKNEIAMDYASRISYLYPIIKAKAANGAKEFTTTAIMKGSSQEYVNEIQFLNAYAHLSLLMPQVRKDTLKIQAIKNNYISLIYPDEATKNAESIDRLYSYLALQMALSPKPDIKLEAWVSEKVKEDEVGIKETDFPFIEKLYDHYNKYYHFIKPLPDEIFQKISGASYEEYHSLGAAVKALGDYFVKLGRGYRNLITATNEENLNDGLLSEYFEWTVCTMSYRMIEWISKLTGIPLEKLVSLINYFLQITSNTTGIAFIEKGYCGEGYLPPFTLLEDHLVFSPLVSKLMMNVNNILYSINKLDKKTFDNEISKHLEPALVCQLSYIFSQIPNITFTKNVNYPGGEIDFIALSEAENVAICCQVKSTIAPDSARTVERVTGRTLEGIAQIEQFDALEKEQKQNIINTAFKTTLKETKIINILVTRSCIGSEKAWRANDKFRLTNYPLLAWLLALKLEKKDYTIINFDLDLLDAQKELIKIGGSTEVFEKFVIGKYEISFPNIHDQFQEIVAMNFKSYKFLGDYDNLNC